MKISFQDQLARIRTRMGQRSAELSATPEQNEAKRKFGRIFQFAHTSRRLAERELEIDREAIRPYLLQLTGDRASLFDNKRNIYIPIVRKKKKNRADDWYCVTAYKVHDEAEARRKATKENCQLIVFNTES